MCKKAITALLNDEVSTKIEVDDLIEELEAWTDETVYVHVINGFQSIQTLEDFNCYISCNGDEELLTLETIDGVTYDVNVENIKFITRDNILNQFYIYLTNGQIIQIYSDAD